MSSYDYLPTLIFKRTTIQIRFPVILNKIFDWVLNKYPECHDFAK